METQTDAHVHRGFSLLALCTLTLALWSWGEAATHYRFKGFDVPLSGVVSTTIHGVDYKSDRMVGEYTDINGLRHGWQGNSTHATQVLLQPIHGINAQKWLVGGFQSPQRSQGYASLDWQGFLWQGSAVTPISIPGCAGVDIGGTSARAVNQAGEVVGTCVDASAAWHRHNGVGTVLPLPFDSCIILEARGINTHGVIVGNCDYLGFSYDHGRITVLNDVQPELEVFLEVVGINDQGVVFGWGCPTVGEDRDCHGFILPPGGPFQFVDYPGSWTTHIVAVHPVTGRLWGTWSGAGGAHAFTAVPSASTTVDDAQLAAR